MAVFGSSIAGFLLAIAILVTIHEMGHYLAARWCGVRVLRFSVGFGPVLLKWTGRRSIFAGTEFAVSAIPLGGYVRMLDTRDPEVAATVSNFADAFDRQRLWKRSFIVAAGPLANFVLAFVLYTAALAAPDRDLQAVVAAPDAGTPAYLAGVRGGMRVTRVNDREVAHWGDIRWQLLAHVFDDQLVLLVDDGGVERALTLQRSNGQPLTPEGISSRLGGWGLSFDQPAIIGRVIAGGPAERGGLLVGDVVVAVDGTAIRQWNQLTRAVQARPDAPVVLTVERRGYRQDVTVTPRGEGVAGKRIGRIDVAGAPPEMLGQDSVVQRQRSPAAAVVDGLQRSVDATVLTVRVLWGMLVGDISLRQISGPLTMAEGAGVTLKQGAVSFALFLAIVSVSIGVLNLLPVPMLDGGQLLYHLFEAIKGAPLSE
ncbi:MAG TPA: RIP metalloprotease RseP, partial [Casimicrobium huifangae]|nr:RIP metalloprotease RseP [Casimicrobium huifangae]